MGGFIRRSASRTGKYVRRVRQVGGLRGLRRLGRVGQVRRVGLVRQVGQVRQVGVVKGGRFFGDEVITFFLFFCKKNNLLCMR